jgi:superfamily II DNA/RNA helicase
LLAKYPPQRETKVEKLIGALGVLWRQNPLERIVIFATYLGSVEMLGAEIEEQYPGQGVTVLKGGDHGAKTAAEKRFKASDGPRVLICTAAGREGINLQHARVLFNFDLPWNPMDLEQRIGRIHRYGQVIRHRFTILSCRTRLRVPFSYCSMRSSLKSEGHSVRWMSMGKSLRIFARKSSDSFQCK